MNRLVGVFCATRRHQKTKKNETQTKVRMAHKDKFCDTSSFVSIHVGAVTSHLMPRAPVSSRWKAYTWWKRSTCLVL